MCFLRRFSLYPPGYREELCSISAANGLRLTVGERVVFSPPLPRQILNSSILVIPIHDAETRNTLQRKHCTAIHAIVRLIYL